MTVNELGGVEGRDHSLIGFCVRVAMRTTDFHLYHVCIQETTTGGVCRVFDARRGERGGGTGVTFLAVLSALYTSLDAHFP